MKRHEKFPEGQEKKKKKKTRCIMGLKYITEKQIQVQPRAKLERRHATARKKKNASLLTDWRGRQYALARDSGKTGGTTLAVVGFLLSLLPATLRLLGGSVAIFSLGLLSLGGS